jgi:hypothetical protein
MTGETDAQPATYENVALVELVDRLIDKGVVLAGDITLSVADIDLVHVSLRLLVSSSDRFAGERTESVT